MNVEKCRRALKCSKPHPGKLQAPFQPQAFHGAVMESCIPAPSHSPGLAWQEARGGKAAVALRGVPDPGGPGLGNRIRVREGVIPRWIPHGKREGERRKVLPAPEPGWASPRRYREPAPHPKSFPRGCPRPRQLLSIPAARSPPRIPAHSQPWKGPWVALVLHSLHPKVRTRAERDARMDPGAVEASRSGLGEAVGGSSSQQG